tara:strand:- start:36 stop:254 length:219 start_codon:yes stop_codon:yes gene_type:complete
MKTLFQRLTVEQQEIILNKEIEYPATWTPIVGQLVGTFTWSKITLEHAMTIYYELCQGGFDLDNYINLFEEE